MIFIMFEGGSIVWSRGLLIRYQLSLREGDRLEPWISSVDLRIMPCEQRQNVILIRFCISASERTVRGDLTGVEGHPSLIDGDDQNQKSSEQYPLGADSTWNFPNEHYCMHSFGLG